MTMSTTVLHDENMDPINSSNPLAVDATLTLPNEGQQTMANSISVAIASDQSQVPVNVSQISGGAIDTNAGNSSAGTQRVVIASDQPVFQVETVPAAASDTESTALANSIVVKGSAGVLYEIVVTNTSGSAQYIQLHDATSLPSNGAVPLKIFAVGAGQTVSYTPLGGVSCSTGITMANSSTAATLTVGSADCWFDGRYQ